MTVNRVVISKFVKGIVRWKYCYLSGIITLSTHVYISLVMCKDVKQGRGPVGLDMTVNL